MRGGEAVLYMQQNSRLELWLCSYGRFLLDTRCVMVVVGLLMFGGEPHSCNQGLGDCLVAIVLWAGVSDLSADKDFISRDRGSCVSTGGDSRSFSGIDSCLGMLASGDTGRISLGNCWSR